MAADSFKRIQPGEKFRPAAEAWNSMLDAAEEIRARRSFGQAGIDIGNNSQVWIQNDGVVDLEQFAIVGLGDAVTLPVDDEGEFLRTMGFGSVAPTAAGRFAILQSNIEVDTMGEARIIGLSHCFISRATASHTMASPVNGDYDKLTAGATGVAEILWMEDTPAAAVGLTILAGTGAPGAGLGADGDYYKDTAASEYYGPKTAGAWGAAHAYGTGICWAVVILDHAADGLTQLNGETGPAVTLQSTGATVTFSVPSANVINLESVGIKTINGLAGPAITHAVGTSGLDHNISPSGSTITHNIPDAGASSRGVVSTGTQTIAGEKTFTTNPIVSTATIPFVTFIESSFTVGLFGKIGTSEIGIAAYGDDGFGNSTKGEVFFYLGTYDPGIPGWFDHTRFVLRAATTSPANVDDMPSYAIKAGVLNYIGVWDTVAGMDVSGGLITGGSLSVPGSAVTGALSATVVADGGTW